MTRVEQFVESLRERSDVSVESQKDAWLVRVPRGDLVCDVIIPTSVHEWFATVRRADDRAELWSDWMDHYGAAEAELDAERANSISAFMERVFSDGIRPPLAIHVEA
jgi:hypothetical protein